MKSKGFTLIELMIVIAIIGILSAIAVPKFADLIRKSNEGATRGNLATMKSAISIYYSENEGKFPNTIASLTTPAIGATTGKYLKEVPETKLPPYGGNSSARVAEEATVTAGFAKGWMLNPNDLNLATVVSCDAATATKTTGDVWVDSTDTDSKGTVWFTY